jgi:hypothetical protein
MQSPFVLHSFKKSCSVELHFLISYYISCENPVFTGFFVTATSEDRVSAVLVFRWSPVAYCRYQILDTHAHTQTHTHSHARAPVWKETLQVNCNSSKLKRIQRLVNIKLAKAYRTTSHEALCMLTGIPPILIEGEGGGLRW